MTYSKIFFYLCLSFIIGIFTASLFSISRIFMFGFLFLVLLALLIFLIKIKKSKTILFFIFCFLFFILGIWRYQSAGLRIKNQELVKYNNQEVILVGKILTEPTIMENNVQLIINAEKIAIREKIVASSGKVLVKTNKYPEYNYADLLIIKGLLKKPEIFNEFNYKDYLAKQGILSLMEWPEIKIVKEKSYSNWRQFAYAQILKFKNKIRENINQYFSFPQNTLLAAMLLGDQSAMPQQLKDNLNITGLRHITAISGMNISILCGILMSLLLGIGFWRNQAFYISLIIIFIFVVMIGFQASIVRAGIMGAIFLLGQKVGRISVSSRAIVITATIMLIINPLLLRWDVGFQLSFLAILGMVFLAPPFERLLKFIPQEKFINLRNIIATTFAAQIFTMPILIYNFGRISLVSPLTNVLILPVIYWVMLFGFLFGILSVIWSGFGWIFILPCWFLISYSLKIIDIFSQPWAAKTVENIHWGWLVLFYLILIVLVIRLNKKSPALEL